MLCIYIYIEREREREDIMYDYHHYHYYLLQEHVALLLPLPRGLQSENELPGRGPRGDLL